MTNTQHDTNSNTYAQGQIAARAHQSAALAAHKSQNARTDTKRDEWADKAIKLAHRAAESDLAFEQPEELTMDAIGQAHGDRAGALFARKQSRVLRKYRDGYADTTSHSGHKSKNNGDDVAIALAGLAAADVMTIADQLLGWDAGTLATKYEKLNEGQKRMNSGNRIRNGFKKGIWTIDQIAALINTNQG